MAKSIKQLMKSGDIHAVIENGSMGVFNRAGQLLWRCEARTQGVEGPSPDVVNGDTPPGLYRAGVVIWTQRSEPQKVWRAYGHVFVDLEEQEAQEISRGRAGVGVHGGGSVLGNPLADRQGWAVTHGCVRLQNEDARRFGHLVDATRKAGFTVWVTVR